MFRNRIFLKSLAIFFVLEMVSSTVWPTISFALTAGPTAPEATSFEPIDTTDMVNTLTGDFTYNTPLLEIPGPSGGYPLSLSYHAGIQTNEEASWVGLGWTLNPGAINRSVNGLADDVHNEAISERTFWEGGLSQSFSFGINVGYGQNSGVSAGLSYSEDTYMGVSQTSFVNVGNLNIQKSTSNLGNGIASSSKTVVSTSIGVGAGLSLNVAYGTGTGFSADAVSKYTGLDSKISSFMNLDFSLSTVKSYLLSNVGISKNSSNSKEGMLSTSGSSFNATIPTPWNFSINIGSSHKRYWIDETETTRINGALYFPKANPTNFDNQAFDVYSLQSLSNIVNDRSPKEQMLGSFVDYDSYNVLAQGVSGSIKPYHYKAYLLHKNEKEKGGSSYYRTKSYSLGVNSNPVSFRFVGDFSNRYLYNHSNQSFNVNNSSLPLSFEFNSNQITGENGNNGFDATKNILPGSKNIEWFTNRQISRETTSDQYGFMRSNPKGFVRAVDDQIGGFMVTNSSGVTYHYALPVYSYDEGSYSGRVDHKGKHLFNQYKKSHKYAYTWLLTAVTGPDFVDVNLNNIPDEGDYGYWVSFEYGKWTDRYNWRNPGEGFNKDIDNSFNNFSKGKKEIYYLNSIKTKTHTAIFVKKIRSDGKGVVPEIDEVVATTNNHSLADIDDGGYDFKSKYFTIPFGPSFGTYSYTEHTVSTLGLTEIFLFENSSIMTYSDITTQIAENSDTYHHLDHARTLSPKLDILYHQGKNVIDTFDIINLRVELEAKAVKRIKFNHDYSLCPLTANSYTSVIDVMNTSGIGSTARAGKLSLQSLSYYGHEGFTLLPNTKFIYDIDASDANASLVSIAS